MNFFSRYENINIAVASLLVEELIRNDIHYFVISPGSRSTPLAIAVTRNPLTRYKLVLDERSAGFYALGYAKGRKKPAVLICTSGTALANYFPAVIEARMTNTPLLVLSADRPFSLQDTGSNQTIEQPQIYGNYTRIFSHIPVTPQGLSAPSILSLVDNILYKMIYAEPGPAHINIAFDEPLHPEIHPYHIDGNESFYEWMKTRNPFTRYFPRKDTSSLTENEIWGNLSESGNMTIVTGSLEEFIQSDEDRILIKKIMEDLCRKGWPVWMDIRSGFFRSLCGISHADFIFGNTTLPPHAAPETILHIGSEMLSKEYYRLLQKHIIPTVIQIKNHANRHDPEYGVTVRLSADVHKLAEIVRQIPECKNHEYSEYWKSSSVKSQALLEDIFKSEKTISEAGFLHHLALARLDSDIAIGNSMPIRNLDMFTASLHPGIAVFSNRGASGIDGFLSSSMGFATATGRPTVIISGDVAALHDLNSLYLSTDIPNATIVLVFNNGGSGIFDYLPIARYPEDYGNLFRTEHSYNMKNFAKGFNLPYYTASPAEEIPEIFYGKIMLLIQDIIIKKEKAVLELFFDREYNILLQKKIHHEFRKHFSTPEQ